MRDGATVPILYEGRKTDWSINEAEIDILFDRWFVDMADEKREELKKKGISLATLAKHPERVRLIALDIWEHFKQVCQPDGFKAQIGRRGPRSCGAYRAALARVIAADLAKGGMDAKAVTAKADGMIACIYSKSQEDNKPSEDRDVAAVRAELEAHFLDDNAEKEAKKRFKAFGEEPSFLIVCDKLLTGFDAPIEAVMYLDKPLKEHGLLQAIARTNRTCSVKGLNGAEITKPHGRIVDYIGVTNHLDEALASYRAEDVQNALRDIAILRATCARLMPATLVRSGCWASMAWTRRRRPIRSASGLRKAVRTTGSSFSDSPATSSASMVICRPIRRFWTSPPM